MKIIINTKDGEHHEWVLAEVEVDVEKDFIAVSTNHGEEKFYNDTIESLVMLPMAS